MAEIRVPSAPSQVNLATRGEGTTPKTKSTVATAATPTNAMTRASQLRDRGGNTSQNMDKGGMSQDMTTMIRNAMRGTTDN